MPLSHATSMNCANPLFHMSDRVNSEIVSRRWSQVAIRFATSISHHLYHVISKVKEIVELNTRICEAKNVVSV